MMTVRVEREPKFSPLQPRFSWRISKGRKVLGAGFAPSREEAEDAAAEAVSGILGRRHTHTMKEGTP